MSLLSQSIVELDFSPESPPAIVGVLPSGQTVNIQLWQDGVAVSLTASGCTEIDSTGRYTWSTSGIPILSASREQFHWRMSDGTNNDDGDFVLVAKGSIDGGMPSLNNQSSYLV